MEFTSPSARHHNWKPGRTKLSDEEIEKVRKRWRNRPTVKTLAVELDISERYLRKLLHNEKRAKKDGCKHAKS